MQNKYYTERGGVIIEEGIYSTFTWTNDREDASLFVLENAHVKLDSLASSVVTLSVTDTDSVLRVLATNSGIGTDFYFDNIRHPLLEEESVILTSSNTGVAFSARIFTEKL